MVRLSCLVVSAFALFAACGGQIDNGDGGTGSDSSTNPPPGQDASIKPDVSNPPPPPPLCSAMTGGGTSSSDGSCGIDAAWSCGDTKYSVQCSCPAKSCTCSQQSGSSGSGTFVTYTGGCPACTVTSTQLAQLCGFPSN